MTRKPLSYDHLTIVDEEPARPAQSPPLRSTASPAVAPQVQTAESELLRDISHQTMLYLHVDGVRAIDEYALANSTLHRKVKRHDVILEAIEEWAAKRGIKAQFRAKERKFKAKRRYVVITE
jgi:hypothetical protein